ncbi:hypothetical protein TrLO_g9453 [Triparma laevis f. longispina]|uniref:Transmembrane protein n=1 Tax=Triparma laevis f. longispina TaxID=1714387 RepID=A0A9W7ASA1_9STRA|nr:hypothetical protein TrLO_g9453 [Triparma laevis f. longispina]
MGSLSSSRSILSILWTLSTLVVLLTFLSGIFTAVYFHSSSMCSICNSMGDYSGNHEDYTSACQTCEDNRGEIENVSKAGLGVNVVLILLNLLFVQGFGTFFVVGFGCGSSHHNCCSGIFLRRRSSGLGVGVFCGALFATAWSLFQNSIVFIGFNGGPHFESFAGDSSYGGRGDDDEQYPAEYYWSYRSTKREEEASLLFGILQIVLGCVFTFLGFLIIQYSDELRNEYQRKLKGMASQSFDSAYSENTETTAGDELSGYSVYCERRHSGLDLASTSAFSGGHLNQKKSSSSKFKKNPASWVLQKLNYKHQQKDPSRAASFTHSTSALRPTKYTPPSSPPTHESNESLGSNHSVRFKEENERKSGLV